MFTAAPPPSQCDFRFWSRFTFQIHLLERASAHLSLCVHEYVVCIHYSQYREKRALLILHAQRKPISLFALRFAFCVLRVAFLQASSVRDGPFGNGTYGMEQVCGVWRGTRGGRLHMHMHAHSRHFVQRARARACACARVRVCASAPWCGSCS